MRKCAGGEEAESLSEERYVEAVREAIVRSRAQSPRQGDLKIETCLSAKGATNVTRTRPKRAAATVPPQFDKEDKTQKEPSHTITVQQLHI
jgi:hypothetical protein